MLQVATHASWAVTGYHYWLSQGYFSSLLLGLKSATYVLSVCDKGVSAFLKVEVQFSGLFGVARLNGQENHLIYPGQ